MIEFLTLTNVFIFGALGAWGYFGYKGEINRWNNGICRESSKPWERFATDSQGGRGYKDSLGNYTWISWPGVDSNYNPQ